MFDPQIRAAIHRAAVDLGVPPAHLETVVYVESGGQAYTIIESARMPLIRWEGHYFYRYLPEHLRALGRQEGLAASSGSAWGEVRNPTDQAERYAMLQRAALIDRQAAYASCSWGVGQVMGANAEWLGYDTPHAMALRAMAGIDGQLELMCRFIAKRQLVEALADAEWARFAHGYNGPGQIDYYAARMGEAYRLITRDQTPRVGDRGPLVEQLQAALVAQGAEIVVDGIYGPLTQEAVERYGMPLELPRALIRRGSQDG